MHDQSCDLPPIDQQILVKIDPTLIFQEGIRTNYPYNSPSGLYANSPLGGFSGKYSTQASSSSSSGGTQPHSCSFSTAALTTMQQGPYPSPFGAMKPSNFPPIEHQMIRSERTSLGDTQNHLDDRNSCEADEIEGERKSQHKVHSSSTILNYPRRVSSNQEQHFIGQRPANTQQTLNTQESSGISCKIQEHLLINEQPIIHNIPQSSFLDKSGESQILRQHPENAHIYCGTFSNVPQHRGNSYLEQCISGIPEENPLNLSYPPCERSFGRFHTPNPHHFHYQQPHHIPHQNNYQPEQQIHNQMHYPSSEMVQGNISQHHQQYTNGSAIQVDSPQNFMQSYLPQSQQYPDNSNQTQGFCQVFSAQQQKPNIFYQQFADYDEFHNEFQTFHPQANQQFVKQHPLQLQEQNYHQQQPFPQQYPQLQSQLGSIPQGNIPILQHPRQFRHFQMQDKMYLQQEQTKLTEQAILELQSEQYQIPLQLSKTIESAMPAMKLEATELSQKSDEDIEEEEENSSSDDSDNPSSSNSSIECSKDSQNSKAKKIEKSSMENQKHHKNSPQRLKGPNSIIKHHYSPGNSKNNDLRSIQISKKQTNETKNIPKNYSKAIIGYIQKHPDQCAKLLGNNLTFSEFEQFLMEKKDKLTAIKDLRSLWTAKAADSKQEIFNKVFRILSFKFFREDAVSYIYSSHKIKNTRALITYRFILQRALHDPESFSFMKFQN